ncbi:MAG: hypothetical protein QM759_17740 [Terricaulis sp.]
MRWTMLATAVALGGACLFVTPAQAQASDGFSGTWGFQSEDYGNDDYGAAMSGVAVITPGSGANKYNIKLLAQEVISQRADGQSHLLVARENCQGEDTNGQLSVTCAMAEPLDNYTPDTFVIQTVDHDHLGGVMTSSSGASVNFNRVR